MVFFFLITNLIAISYNTLCFTQLGNRGNFYNWGKGTKDLNLCKSNDSLVLNFSNSSATMDQVWNGAVGLN
jgi:hypothetical protein